MPIFSIILITHILASNAAAAEKVWIGGWKYPAGCERVEKLVNGRVLWGVVCPKTEEDPHLERIKKRPPPSVGGFLSTGVSRQPMPLDPRSCKEAIVAFGDNSTKITEWLRKIMYGHPKARVFTYVAARQVYIRIESYALRAIRHAENLYRYALRGEDAAEICVKYLDGAGAELERIHGLLKAEATKGNRDLEETGLNARTSVYSK